MSFGYATSGELIAAIASERQIGPPALTKQLEAARFLRSTYPHLIAGRRVLGGYSQTEYLQKIHAVSPERAEALAPRVIAGEISMPAIREQFNEAVAASGGAGSAGSMARRRVVEFERACRDLLSQHLVELSGVPDASLAPDYDLNGYALDYAIHQGDRVMVAVECRTGGMRASRREAFELFATLATLTRRAESACLLIPASARALGDAVDDLAKRWKVDRLRVGLVIEDKQPRLDFLLHDHRHGPAVQSENSRTS